MVDQLDVLHQIVIRRQSRKPQSGGLEVFAVSVVDLPAMTVSLVNQ
jgi:hypothetical protein